MVKQKKSIDEVESDVLNHLRNINKAGDGDPWQRRAIDFFQKSILILKEIKDVDISFVTLRNVTSIDSFVKFAYDEFNGDSKIQIGGEIIDRKDINISEDSKQEIRSYLENSPHFDYNDAINGHISQECYKLEGFLSMQIEAAIIEVYQKNNIQINTTLE